jgi:hypothetical protein
MCVNAGKSKGAIVAFAGVLGVLQTIIDTRVTSLMRLSLVIEKTCTKETPDFP